MNLLLTKKLNITDMLKANHHELAAVLQRAEANKQARLKREAEQKKQA